MGRAEDRAQRMDEVRKGFADYYNAESDLFGNNVAKDVISPMTIVRSYINFFKNCRIMEKLLQHGFNRLPEYKILDAGCGNGQDLRSLVEFGAKPENCHGIDFCDKALEFARTVSPPEMDFRQVPFFSNGFDDNIFDIVFSYNVITNFIDNSDIKCFGREARRVIKNNGLLLLICTIDDEARQTSGVAGLGVRTFTINDIVEFFPQFQIVDVASASVLKNDFDKNIIVKDMDKKEAHIEAIFNLAEQLKGQQSYDYFYTIGAMKHLVYGLEIVKSGLKLLVMKPKN